MNSIYSTVIAGIRQLAETKQSPEQTVINFVVTPGDCFASLAMTSIFIGIRETVVHDALKPPLGVPMAIGMGVKPAEDKGNGA